MSVDQPGFDYFECQDCGFDSVQISTFNGSYACPLCAGDSGHDVAMSRRAALTTDTVEGFDARKGTRVEQKAALASAKASASSRSTGEA